MRTGENIVLLSETESSGDTDEVGNKGKERRERNRCAEAHQEGSFILVVVENCEGKVRLMFYLLSPKLD